MFQDIQNMTMPFGISEEKKSMADINVHQKWEKKKDIWYFKFSGKRHSAVREKIMDVSLSSGNEQVINVQNQQGL